MQGTTQPIDRQTLLEKANKLIREHEDTLAEYRSHRRRSAQQCPGV